jgi:Secretion system C-terminal sorting domain
LADYNSNARTKIRSNYAPAIETIAEQAKGHLPENNTNTAFYDNVTLDWEDVPGADAYLVEIDRQSSLNSSTTIRIITKTSSTLLQGKLEASKSYYWRVIPYDAEGGTCLPIGGAAKLKFTTSAFVLGAKDIASMNQWTVAPNPVAKGQSLFVDMTVAAAFDATISLYNSIGQEVQSLGNQSLVEGQTRFTFDTNNLTQGVYFVRIQSEKGTESKRVVIE